MPGRQGEHVVDSPVRKSKLSLKFFHKKETKRALDFSEAQPEEPKTSQQEEPETSCDQVVFGPSPRPSSPGLLLSGEKRENLVPFVGLSNLGNTCYLNSIIQVLYYCPGFREGIKKLYDLSTVKDEPKEASDESDEQAGGAPEAQPTSIQLLRSFRSLITSVEQLQSSFLLNPHSLSEGELAATPRILLHTLRQLNPMYEGFFQHDAQEVLQCILGYVHEAYETIKKEKKEEGEDDDDNSSKVEGGSDSASSGSVGENKPASEEDGQVGGKRKSDTEVGNAKKKPKSVKARKSDPVEENLSENGPMTRSKRRSSSNITMPGSSQTCDAKEEEEKKKKTQTSTKQEGSNEEEKDEKTSKETKRKRKSKLSWLRPSGKQPSIFSKFRSVGNISSSVKSHNVKKAEPQGPIEEIISEPSPQETLHKVQEKEAAKTQGDLSLMEHLFQGRLVLRTRCLECESFTERKEDFQDISVPVLDDQPSSPDNLSEVSPDPKPELKTLKWAIGQFASVERIVGEDKYFCETCRHYTEAERSLLFDKTPEVITIHLKRFSAHGLELDPYAGLSKVNTPLQTPLSLSLEEWCTRSMPTSRQHYQLFAVVMHSGVTISSGHYTAYIRMSDLKHVKLCTRDRKEAKEEPEEEKERGEKVQEVKEEVPDYDDGEVSISRSSRGQRRASLTGNKKLSEGGVGLLGGQRSTSSCELGSKHTEKAAGAAAAAQGSKRRKTVNSCCPPTAESSRVQEEQEEAQAAPTSRGGDEASEQQALSSLQEYEGKWLLFDDSEVRLFEEEDFLRACSPETSSSLTPYLLFYRRKEAQ